MNGAHTFKTADRESSYADLLDQIQGADDTASIYDDFTDLTLPELKESLTKRLSSPKLKDRDALYFDLALYRSLRYAAASSRHCMVLGKVNNIREIYEGYRLRYPTEKAADGNTKLK